MLKLTDPRFSYSESPKVDDNFQAEKGGIELVEFTPNRKSSKSLTCKKNTYPKQKTPR